MGFADTIRIMFGKLTPAEIEERDAEARARQQAKIAAAEAETTRNAAEVAALAARRAASEQEAQVHRRRISRAAGVATLELRCHADTWEWIKIWMDQELQYSRWWKETHKGRVVAESPGMVCVSLSGTQTAEVVARLGWVAGVSEVTRPHYRVPPADATDRVIGWRLYSEIGKILDSIDTTGATKDQIPVVVLDNRPGADAQDSERS